MLQHLFLLASAALLASAQAPPPPPSALGCTSKSFTAPSWLVESFKAAGGNVSFHLFNRATNGTTEVACTVSGDSWSHCTSSEKLDLDASIQLNGTVANLKLNETWVCKDREGSDRLTFSASASGAIDLTGTEALTAKNPQVLFAATLTSPVAVTPAYLKGPTGHDKAGCRATSKNPSWVVSSAYLTDQGGDGISSMASTSMSLIMTNTANDYQVSCMADNGFAGGAPSAPGTPFGLACAGYEFQSFTTGRYSLSTTASFDPEKLVFNVTQTWYCDDTDPGRPVSVKATASQVLPLECSTSMVAGNFTKKTCQAEKDITVKGTLVSEDPLPAFSIEDPIPAADGCTISSIFKPQWSISNFALYGKQGSELVGFNIILQTGTRGFQYPISVMQGAPLPDVSDWSQCEIGPDGDIGEPLWPSACALRYNNDTKMLTISADWKCFDLDEKHPTIFSGTTTTLVNSTFTCDADGTPRCQTADPGYTWIANIANVTWAATP